MLKTTLTLIALALITSNAKADMPAPFPTTDAAKYKQIEAIANSIQSSKQILSQADFNIYILNIFVGQYNSIAKRYDNDQMCVFAKAWSRNAQSMYDSYAPRTKQLIAQAQQKVTIDLAPYSYIIAVDVAARQLKAGIGDGVSAEAAKLSAIQVYQPTCKSGQ